MVKEDIFKKYIIHDQLLYIYTITQNLFLFFLDSFIYKSINFIFDS